MALDVGKFGDRLLLLLEEGEGEAVELVVVEEEEAMLPRAGLGDPPCWLWRFGAILFFSSLFSFFFSVARGEQ